MRVYNFQQMAGKGWILQFKFQLNTSRQKGTALKQTFYIGVQHLDAIHAQTGGNLRIRVRKLRPHLAQISQFAFVVFKQPCVHLILAHTLKGQLAGGQIYLGS